MAKRKTTTAKKTAGGKKSRRPTLASVRTKIDKIDRDLVKLMNERAKLALQIGQLKADAGETVYRPEREEEVMARVVKFSKGPLTNQCVRSVFRELVSGSRSVQRSGR